jgi:hypothetical protein
MIEDLDLAGPILLILEQLLPSYPVAIRDQLEAAIEHGDLKIEPVLAGAVVIDGRKVVLLTADGRPESFVPIDLAEEAEPS